MKHLLLSVAVVAATLMASCGSSEATQKNETDLKAKIENCTNTDSLKVYVDQVKDYAEKLVNEGKVEEAKKYLAEMQPVVDKYAPSLSSTLVSVQSVLDKVPSSPTDSLKEKGGEAVDSLKSNVGQAYENTKDAASSAVGIAKEKVTDAAKATADKTKEVAGDVKDGVKSAAKATGEKAKEVAGDVKDGVKNAAQATGDKIKSIVD